MRIVIRSWPSVAAAPWRAYAEYRVFCRLAAMAGDITSVHVAVRRTADGTIQCAIRANLGSAGTMRARGHRHEPTGAIDMAVEELAKVTIRRLQAVGRGPFTPRARTASSCARE